MTAPGNDQPRLAAIRILAWNAEGLAGVLAEPAEALMEVVAAAESAEDQHVDQPLLAPGRRVTGSQRSLSPSAADTPAASGYDRTAPSSRPSPVPTLELHRGGTGSSTTCPRYSTRCSTRSSREAVGTAT